ncbi:linear amide C-N hydrolase [Facklamia sp. P12932]
MCTGVKITSKENNVYWGRTQEFNMDLDYSGCVVPRNYEVKDALSSFVTKYAVLGVGVKQIPYIIADGVNEKGLCGGTFYFANYFHYSEANEVEETGRLALAGAEFVTYALSMYSSVDEVRKNANKDVAIAFADRIAGIPQHFVFQDNTGDSIVVEPSKKGEFVIIDNPVGIFTNAPTFDWHLTNLQNYAGIKQVKDEGFDYNGFEVFSPGLGSGLRGLPGDFTPQSRFIRAFYLKALSSEVNNDKAVELIFHILNSFDAPKGIMYVSGETDLQYTQYTSAYDIEKAELFVHTYDNRTIQTLKLADFDLDKDEVVHYPLVEKQQYLDLKKESKETIF